MGRVKDRLLLDEEGRPQKAEAELLGQAKVSTCTKNTEANDFNVYASNHKDLLEQICDRDNMAQAYLKVRRNKGAGGIDNMTVDELDSWLRENYEALISRLLTGRYRPAPVKRVEIPKEEKGKMRKLGIPTVVDRMLQQAVMQVLTPIYEPLFSDNSYGFRPMRSAHGALLAIQQYANKGYVWCVSLDIERFFDTVNQSKLIELISHTIKDGRVISLIHRFLMAGVMVDGALSPTEQGTPQGGPLSPLLANILLDELDRELEKRGHVFVRYADDSLILKKTQKAALRTGSSITHFIEKKLFLKVNRDKTVVARLNKGVKYLGYGFYQKENEWHLRVHPKSVDKIKAKIRLITARSNGKSLDRRRYELKMLVNGWVNYFKLADAKRLTSEIDSWCRRRIRVVYWRQWKRIRTKISALVKLGIPKDQAFQWANSRKAYWRIAGSPVLKRSLTNAKLKELGWVTFSDRYQACRTSS